MQGRWPREGTTRLADAGWPVVALVIGSGGKVATRLTQDLSLPGGQGTDVAPLAVHGRRVTPDSR